MLLHQPYYISSFLSPAIKVDGKEIAVIELDTLDYRGKAQWRIMIDENDCDTLRGPSDAREAFETLYSFLSAWNEARSESSDNWDLFPDSLREWSKGVEWEMYRIDIGLDEDTGELLPDAPEDCPIQP